MAVFLTRLNRSLKGNAIILSYGHAGHDLRIGADILTRAALSDQFSNASGRYYDNDRKSFAAPHPDALDATKNRRIIDAIEQLIH